MPVPAGREVRRRPLLRDDVYLSIRDAIVDGSLAPDERLRDTELAARLGVSRTPVREALLRLERAGLVVATPGRSTVVAPIDSQVTASAQQLAAALHELAVRLAVPRLRAADLAAMRAANHRFAAALDAHDAAAAMSADDEFHGVAIAVCGNELIAGHLEEVAPVLHRVERRRFGSLAGRASVVAHERIVAACVAGDTETAALAARENWLSLGDRS